MKNQYFGDTRDLFKYDLILEILRKSDILNHFTFIPMLTGSDGTSDGMKIDYSKAKAGVRRKELVDFLQRCVRSGRRNIEELKRFFKDSELTKELSITIYKKDEHFSHEERGKYFAEIGKKLLSKSLILVDPDTGLEVESMRGMEEKYVKYEEVKSLYDRMARDSVLMIWQFIPRVKRKPYFSKVSKRLKKKVGNLPIWISDNKVVFFLLTKDPGLRESIGKIVDEYGKFYQLGVGNL